MHIFFYSPSRKSKLFHLQANFIIALVTALQGDQHSQESFIRPVATTKTMCTYLDKMCEIKNLKQKSSKLTYWNFISHKNSETLEGKNIYSLDYYIICLFLFTFNPTKCLINYHSLHLLSIIWFCLDDVSLLPFFSNHLTKLEKKFLILKPEPW